MIDLGLGGVLRQGAQQGTADGHPLHFPLWCRHPGEGPEASQLCGLGRFPLPLPFLCPPLLAFFAMLQSPLLLGNRGPRGGSQKLLQRQRRGCTAEPKPQAHLEGRESPQQPGWNELPQEGWREILGCMYTEPVRKRASL